MPVLLHPSEWINRPLIKEPMNWAIIGVIASIWLIAFHFVVSGFTAMQGSVVGQSVGGGGPGTIAAPQAGGSVVGMFAVAGNTGVANFRSDTSSSWFGGDTFWTDGFEAKYAEDGWVGNP